MLLPSALPCELRAPHVSASPLRRSTRANRNITLPFPYQSPPREEIPQLGLVSVTTTGLLQTCRRLQAILSVERLSSPAPSLAPAANITSGTRRSNRRTEAPTTSALRPRRQRASKTPVRKNKNKRTCSDAFPPPPSSPVSTREESDNSDKDFNARFTTPPPKKRIRLTTPPPPPNRGPRRGQMLGYESDEDVEIVWTDEEDRLLVEMVLGKLNLSKNEWDECARTLGKKDGQSVGKRWEDLLGNVGLKNGRRRPQQLRNKRRRI